MSSDLRRDFTDRAELVAYLQTQFPQAAERDAHVSPTVGGYKAAQTMLAQIDPANYAQTRNYLNGKVTQLSPYIRHGVLSLAEVRDAGLQKAGNKQAAYKFVDELARRDFFQRVYARIGDGIWVDREPYKTGYYATDYAAGLPSEIENSTTGLVCMDGFAKQLRETGYLHNHARMYVAAYVVHHRKVAWQAGARWFLTHLLDGDPASNNLSWQWVASTFSHKPYFFNRENLERYTHGHYCQTCPLLGHCDFEGSYEAVEQRLFPQRGSPPPNRVPSPPTFRRP